MATRPTDSKRNSRAHNLPARCLFLALFALLCVIHLPPVAAQESEGIAGETAQDPNAALIAAIRADAMQGVASALENGADPNMQAFLPPLHLAAVRGDADIVEALLDAGADIDLGGSNGRSALITALLSNQYQIAQVLIARGADVNQSETNPGRSPLQLVIDEAPSLEAMTMLLDAGAFIDQKDNRGETALASAAFMNRPEAAELLIERGATVNITNTQGISPLAWAERQGNAAIVDILAQAGARD